MSLVRHVPISWNTPLSWSRQGWDMDTFNPERQLRMMDREMRDMNLNSGSRDLDWWSRDSNNLSNISYDPHNSLRVMDREMKRMSEEMNRMFSHMQHIMPSDSNPDSWRLRENYLLDNPIVQDGNGRKFRLQFDVRQFKPEEILVKTDGKLLSVHAKHEEKGDNKSSFREYHRQYLLPDQVNPESLVSKLSHDGLLSIDAPLPALEGKMEKAIPIQHS
ncbi:alpha-crystallin B chain-like isoform X1 [Gigantopelta aegis]|uniref:alpha-crystallin B chain-like isoform X1 n=1 Tax=Gigantopelta aegis TaxID=1735272 RepID=UPI001B8889FA|nr:alpha-crystallin B chain-like isoform X1 [Gigantopelta aegis]XP_041368905.1 alpha-crystallin B chain-like isoform X1 [Gigantopelta aegis]